MYLDDDIYYPTHKITYQAEISPEDIKSLIHAAMNESNITANEIPKEDSFFVPCDVPRKSKRYFEAEGFAWFVCPKKHNCWLSAHSWCFIDLKKEEICYRDKQKCKVCETDVSPQFIQEAVQKMAVNAVKKYLKRAGRKMQFHLDLYAKVPTGNSSATQLESEHEYDHRTETEESQHDEGRCGRCIRLRKTCWK